MKIGRNTPCPCGSGKKYKHCCYEKDLASRQAAAITASEDADVENASVDEGANSSEQNEKDSKQPAREKRSFQERRRQAEKGARFPNSADSN